MYIRFVCSEDHPTADGELGMFTARDNIDFAVLRGSIRKAHEEAFYWFSEHGGGGLTFPRLSGKQRNSNVRKSLFWFREDAAFFGHEKGSVVRRARELANAITDAGTEIREIKVKDPGIIIWEDLRQVLARPQPGQIPRAFKLT